MAHRQLPPVAAVISFIDCINRGDLDGLGLLMTDDHELVVFDEQALRGKTANAEAWRGYAAAFPRYMIYPRVITEPRAEWVAVLGYTTGSHLGLTDLEERALPVIWLAEVRNGQLRCWRVLKDTADRRSELGLGQSLAPGGP